MVDFPPELADKAMNFAHDNIPDDILYLDPEDPTGYGRETHIHTTVCYGLDPAMDRQRIKDVVDGLTAPVKVKLGKISKFEPEDYDVIKAEVESPDLHALHDVVKALGVPGETYPDYKPHLTLAYVKKGSADHLLGQSPFEGEEFELTSFDYSAPPEPGAKDKHTKYQVKAGKVRAAKGVFDFKEEYDNGLKFWMNPDGTLEPVPEGEGTHVQYLLDMFEEEGILHEIMKAEGVSDDDIAFYEDGSDRVDDGSLWDAAFNWADDNGWVRIWNVNDELAIESTDETKVTMALKAIAKYDSALLFVSTLLAGDRDIPVDEGEDAQTAWDHRNSPRKRVVGAAGLSIPAGVAKNIKGFDGSLANVKNWQAKIVVANNGPKEKKGTWDSVGYVMVNPKTGVIVPIARGDEHQTGYDLLDHYQNKGFLNAKGFIPVNTGFNYFDMKDPKFLEVIKFWMENGGPDSMIHNHGTREQGRMSEWLSGGGKRIVETGKLAAGGKTWMKSLERFTNDWAKIPDNRDPDEGLVDNLFDAAFDMQKIAREWHFMWGSPGDVLSKLFTAKDVWGLGNLILGNDGIKNRVHTQLKGLMDNPKDYEFQDFKSFFGDMELAKAELDRLGGIKGNIKGRQTGIRFWISPDGELKTWESDTASDPWDEFGETSHGFVLFSVFPEFEAEHQEEIDRDGETDVAHIAIRHGYTRGIWANNELDIELGAGKSAAWALEKLPPEYLLVKSLNVGNDTVQVLEGEDAQTAWDHRKDARHRVAAIRVRARDLDRMEKGWLDADGDFVPVQHLHPEVFMEEGEDNGDSYNYGEILNDAHLNGWTRLYHNRAELGLDPGRGKSVAWILGALAKAKPEWLVVSKVFVGVDRTFSGEGEEGEVDVLEGEDAETAWAHRKDARHRVDAANKFDQLYKQANTVAQDDAKYSGALEDPALAQEQGQFQQQVKDARSEDDLQRVWNTFQPSVSWEALTAMVDQPVAE